MKLINLNAYDIKVPAYKRYAEMPLKAKGEVSPSHPNDLTVEGAKYYESLAPILNLEFKLDPNVKLGNIKDVEAKMFDALVNDKVVEVEVKSEEPKEEVKPVEPVKEEPKVEEKAEPSLEDQLKNKSLKELKDIAKKAEVEVKGRTVAKLVEELLDHPDEVSKVVK